MAKLSVAIANINYRNLIMDTKDFDQLCNILSRVTVVDSKYLEDADGGYQYLTVVCDEPPRLEATTTVSDTITEEEFKRRKDAILEAKAARAEQPIETA